jgi:hypothetical protein
LVAGVAIFQFQVSRRRGGDEPRHPHFAHSAMISAPSNRVQLPPPSDLGPSAHHSVVSSPGRPPRQASALSVACIGLKQLRLAARRDGPAGARQLPARADQHLVLLGPDPEREHLSRARGKQYTNRTSWGVPRPARIKQKPRLSGAFVQSGRQDLNLRPPGPQPGALPDCATPRGRSMITPACPAAISHRPARVRASGPSERATGIEPALEAWKASVQPQHFARASAHRIGQAGPSLLSAALLWGPRRPARARPAATDRSSCRARRRG